MEAKRHSAHARRSFVVHSDGPERSLVLQDLHTLERTQVGSLDDLPRELRACLEARNGHAHAPRPLTEAEARVAALAAEGMSNKAIGAALDVRLRTVESHLTSVYRKLGVKSRVELAPRLDEAGL